MLSPGVNAKSEPVPREVRFLASPSDEAEAPKGLSLCAASVPVLSKHPLGKPVELGNSFIDLITFD